MTLRVDAGVLVRLQRTPRGGAYADAFIERTGVYEYRNADGTTRREYVPASVLARDDSLVGTPITEGHSALVTPENYRALNRGTVLRARADGKRTQARITIEDADTLARVDTGDLVEFSPAYDVEYDGVPGVSPEGERFDGTQTKRVYNHIAILRRNEARGGRDMALRLDSAAAICDAPFAQNENVSHTPIAMAVRFDGREYDNETLALGAASAALEAARAATIAANAKVEQATARADAADVRVKQAEDPKRVAALVDARVRLDSSARAVCGATYEPNGKSEREVLVDVIRADDKDFKDELDGKPRSDEYLRARFDGVIARGVRADGVPNIPRAIQDARQDAGEDKTFPDTQAAQARLRSDMQNAWKPKQTNGAS